MTANHRAWRKPVNLAKTRNPGLLAEMDNTPVRGAEVEIEQLPGGRMRVTLAANRRWSMVAASQADLARVLQAAMNEQSTIVYADDRGTVHDLDDIGRDPRLDRRVQKLTAKNRHRRDSYDPRLWRVDVRGRWVSPGGLRYRPNAQVVQRVVAARRELGLPDYPQSGEVDQIPADAPTWKRPVLATAVES